MEKDQISIVKAFLAHFEITDQLIKEKQHQLEERKGTLKIENDGSGRK